MRNSSYMVSNRREEIFRRLQEQGTLFIDQLSQDLNVSEVTIRRDLNILEASGNIIRFHGGAKLSTPNRYVSTMEEKLHLNIEEKILIAQKAAKFIHHDDMVFINTGSTVTYIPQHIESDNVTIITNNARLPICEYGQNITLHMTGGALDRKMMSLTGHLAIHALEQMYASVCLIGVNGITAENGITTSIYQEAEVNALMINRCQGKRIVVADSSKVGRALNFVTAPISSIDILITTTRANQECIRQLRESGVEVVLVPFS